MGKGRIVTAHGEGRYTLEILEDRARAETARALAVQRIDVLDQRITGLDQEATDAQQAVDDAADALDAAIIQHQQDIQDKGESNVDTTTTVAELQELAAKRDAIRGHIRAAKAERLSLQTRIDRIDALPPLRQIEAWCADYTEDLAGEVATAEVPSEIGQVVIKPGFDDAAAWSPSTDGAMQPALAGTPASVFYNLAMLPGWQRWRPTFRIATVSNIDNDLCDITLDAATSSQQRLNVNAQASYTGVPIMYMDCNGSAFEEGDRVLVAFSGNTEQPMVVGFESDPRPCRPEIWVAFINRSVGFTDGGWALDEGVYSQQYTPAEEEEGLRGAFSVWQEDIDNFNAVMGDRATEWAGRCLCGVLRLSVSDVWYVAPDDTAPVPLHVTGKTTPADLTPSDIEDASLAVDSGSFRGRITIIVSSEEVDEDPATAWDLIQPVIQAFVDEHGEKYSSVRLMMVSTESADDYPGYGTRWMRWLTVSGYDGERLNSLDPASEVAIFNTRTW